MRGSRRHPARGFSLIETTLVVVIVGVATVAMMQLIGTGSQNNADSYALTNGLNLAGSVRERMQAMGVAGSMSLDGMTYSPPIDARGRAIPEFEGWSQTVSVQKVSEAALRQNVPQSTSTPTARVTVTVRRRGEEICSIRWLTVEMP